MDADELYKRLLKREDLKDIPIAFVLKVAYAVIKELVGDIDD